MPRQRSLWLRIAVLITLLAYLTKGGASEELVGAIRACRAL